MVKTPYILNTLANLKASVIFIENTLSGFRAEIANVNSRIGVDGSSAVYKNGNFWLRDQNGLYHLVSCYVVGGQTQTSLDNTGYAYAAIP